MANFVQREKILTHYRLVLEYPITRRESSDPEGNELPTISRGRTPPFLGLPANQITEEVQHILSDGEPRIMILMEW